eukprot:UN00970
MRYWCRHFGNPTREIGHWICARNSNEFVIITLCIHAITMNTFNTQALHHDPITY